jgi:hypothetical protein
MSGIVSSPGHHTQPCADWLHSFDPDRQVIVDDTAECPRQGVHPAWWLRDSWDAHQDSIDVQQPAAAWITFQSRFFIKPKLTLLLPKRSISIDDQIIDEMIAARRPATSNRSPAARPRCQHRRTLYGGGNGTLQLTSECQLSDGHPGSHRMEEVLFPSPPESDGHLDADILEDLMSLDPDFDRHVDRFDRIVGDTGRLNGMNACGQCPCGPYGICSRPGTNCPCLARWDRKREREPLPYQRPVYTRPPDPWSYDRPIPPGYHPAPGLHKDDSQWEGKSANDWLRYIASTRARRS